MPIPVLSANSTGCRYRANESFYRCAELPTSTVFWASPVHTHTLRLHYISSFGWTACLRDHFGLSPGAGQLNSTIHSRIPWYDDWSKNKIGLEGVQSELYNWQSILAYYTSNWEYLSLQALWNTLTESTRTTILSLYSKKLNPSRDSSSLEVSAWRYWDQLTL